MILLYRKTEYRLTNSRLTKVKLKRKLTLKKLEDKVLQIIDNNKNKRKLKLINKNNP